jgi:hypothetical protein
MNGVRSPQSPWLKHLTSYSIAFSIGAISISAILRSHEIQCLLTHCTLLEKLFLMDYAASMMRLEVLVTKTLELKFSHMEAILCK